jgi:hypothetical protein
MHLSLKCGQRFVCAEQLVPRGCFAFLRGVHRVAGLRQRGFRLLDRGLRQLDRFIGGGNLARDELRPVRERGPLQLERRRALFDLTELARSTFAIDLEAPQLIAALARESIGEIDTRPQLRDGSTRCLLGAGATPKLIGCLTHLVLEPRPFGDRALAVGMHPLAYCFSFTLFLFGALAPHEGVPLALFGHGNLAAQPLCRLPLCAGETRQLGALCLRGSTRRVGDVASDFVLAHVSVCGRHELAQLHDADLESQ